MATSALPTPTVFFTSRKQCGEQVWCLTEKSSSATLETTYYMHRFFVTTTPVDGRFSITDRELVHQIKDVLDLKPAEQIIVVPGDGTELLSEIVSVGVKEISLKIIKKQPSKPASKRTVALYCALLKRDNFEWVVQKATEAGASEIVPVITDRTVKLGFNKARTEKIAKEASEQSHRGTVPVIREPVPFEKALDEVKPEAAFFLDFAPKQLTPNDVAETGSVALLVGPEGGWSEAERERAKQAGLAIRSLGAPVLRGETAAVVATYIAAQL